MSKRLMALLVSAAVLSAPDAWAEPTPVMVRALSADAKFIGGTMGGVRVKLRDVRTGALLAEGLTEGGTGDTNLLMRQPRVRGARISDASSAGFRATLDLDRPTLVRAEATGPVGKPGSAITVTSTMWLLPGRPVEGDGWILTFPGLVVEPTWKTVAGRLEVKAKVTLMCGCPIEPGGLWDAGRYKVEIALLDGAERSRPVTMDYAGEASVFAASLPKPPRGRYRLLVTAADQNTPNVGVAESPIRID